MDISIIFILMLFLCFNFLDLLLFPYVPCVVTDSKGKEVITLVQVKRKYRTQISKKLNLSDVEID